ncbi:MAG: hypothetical protein ACK4SX_08440 [Alcanivoracaceae bacterium]
MKSTVLQVRLDPELDQSFRLACDQEHCSPGDVVRAFCKLFATAAEFRYSTSKIDVDIGDPQFDGERYTVQATVSGDWVQLVEDRTDFLLPHHPNDTSLKGMTIESHHAYRSTFPNCRAENGRSVGASLKKTDAGTLFWEGAIFFSIYQPDVIQNPNSSLIAAKRALEDSIREAISEYFRDSSPFEMLGIDGTSGGIVSDFKNCTITFKRPARYAYGAWKMSVSLKLPARKQLTNLDLVLKVPRISMRIIHPDPGYTGVARSEDALSIGLRFVDGVAKAHVYTNGVMEEENQTSLSDVARSVADVIDSYFDTDSDLKDH